MFAYLAFKGLGGSYPYGLGSPYIGTYWKFDQKLQLPVLEAEKGTFEAGHGVYAGTVDKANEYAHPQINGAVYLVAPLPGKQAVVASAGWRAEAAVCLGPFTEENKAQIARLIVDAFAMGFPQVPAILVWAIEVISQAAGRTVCPREDDLLDLLRNGGTTAWLESFLPYLDRTEDKLAMLQRMAAMPNAGIALRFPWSYLVTLVLSEASGKLVMPNGVQLERLINHFYEDVLAAWLGRMAPYLSAEELSHACELLLDASKSELLAKARQVWLERATPPSNVTEGEMNHRRAWEVLALVKAHGVSRCPQEILKAAYEFAMQRKDFAWDDQLRQYCNDEEWEAFSKMVDGPSRLSPARYTSSKDRHARFYQASTSWTDNLDHLRLAGHHWPARRVSNASAAALREHGHSY